MLLTPFSTFKQLAQTTFTDYAFVNNKSFLTFYNLSQLPFGHLLIFCTLYQTYLNLLRTVVFHIKK